MIVIKDYKATEMQTPSVFRLALGWVVMIKDYKATEIQTHSALTVTRVKVFRVTARVL
jgi:hypothetical protein